ncbi:MAG: NAD-dependent epimerase/dehydratase family protein [Pseudomonadota bacterium]
MTGTGKKILVAGGGNQVAAFLLPALLRAGHRVRVHSRRSRPAWVAEHAQLTWDVGPWHQAHHAAADAQALIYLAPLDQFPALWCGLSGVARVVCFSSTSRLSKADSADDAERAVASVLASGEQQVSDLAAAAGAALAVLRPTLIYGAGLDRNITRLARFLLRWRVMPILGTGGGRRQPVHAADLAGAAQALIDRAAPLSGTYELTGGETLGYRDMVSRIFASLNLPPRFIRVPAGLARAAVPLLRRTRRWRDLNPSMLVRMNQDLVYDPAPATHDFGYAPRPFRPTRATWLRLDQRSHAEPG